MRKAGLAGKHHRHHEHHSEESKQEGDTEQKTHHGHHQFELGIQTEIDRHHHREETDDGSDGEAMKQLLDHAKATRPENFQEAEGSGEEADESVRNTFFDLDLKNVNEISVTFGQEVSSKEIINLLLDRIRLESENGEILGDTFF